MKVIYFTFFVPSMKFGGGIAVIQSIRGLCQNAVIDYIGPEFDPEEILESGIHLNDISIIKSDTSKLKRGKNLLLNGVTTSFYDSWEKAVKKKDPSEYDCVYLDSSRQSFVARWAKKVQLPLIVRTHNVEYDYFKSLYQENRKLITLAHSVLAKKNEKVCMKLAAKVLVLTEHDNSRLTRLYNTDILKIRIMPVCVDKYINGIKLHRKKPYILLAGSFWFGPNADGAEWFLKNVWNELDEDIGNSFDLLVVGANPNAGIAEIVNSYKNAYLFADPKDIRPFYSEAELFIAPIFYGAGMKVKVAEALANSLMVVGTSHALTGYEEAESFLYSAESKDEFIDAIKDFLKKPNVDKVEIKRKIEYIFENNYSIDSCRRAIFNTLTEVCR